MEIVQLSALLVIGLIVLTLVIKLRRIILGGLLIGVLVLAALCVSGDASCPLSRPSLGPPPAVGAAVLQTQYESFPDLAGHRVGVDPATGYERWESSPVQKVTGTVVNVGTGIAHNTRVLIAFCGHGGAVLYRGEVLVGGLSPGQSSPFEHTGPRLPQLLHAKAQAYDGGAQPLSCP